MGARVGSFGKAVYFNNGKCVGISTGNGGFCEHDVTREDVQCAVKMLNEGVRKKSIKLNLKFRNSLKKLPIEIRQDVLHPGVNYLRKKVEIRNKGCSSEYSTFQTEDGYYEMFCIGTNYTVSCVKDTLGKKRIFAEPDLFFMNDYQWSNNTYTLGVEGKSMITSWSCSLMTNTIYCFSEIRIMVADYLAPVILDPLEYNLLNGTLAVQAGGGLGDNLRAMQPWCKTNHAMGLDLIFLSDLGVC